MRLAEAIARARELAEAPGRRLLGLVGPPGAGKSTLAATLVEAMGDRAALVPMDGFHLADVQLRRLGRLERKGAPDTFDVGGYLALLERLRAAGPGTVYAPMFERTLEQPIAGGLDVGPGVSLVVTEGNYLLLDDPDWRAVRAVLHEVWWVDSDPLVRRRELIERHVLFGKSRPAAQAWVASVDDPNTRLVESTRAGADRVVAAWTP